MGGLDWKGFVGWGVACPAFSVDAAGLCGPPYTDTLANESDLVSISQENSISMSLCLPEQSTATLIFQCSFYLNANTAQHNFCQGGCERKNIGKDGEGKSESKRDRQKDSEKDFVFSGFQLVLCNSPTGSGVAFSVLPSRTSKKKPDIQTTEHTVETFE